MRACGAWTALSFLGIATASPGMLELDGGSSGCYVSLPNVAGSIFNTFTVEMWVYAHTHPSFYGTMMLGTDTVMVETMPDGLRVSAWNSRAGGTGTMYLTLCPALLLNTWYHIAATVDSTTSYSIVYVNGRLQRCLEAPPSPPPPRERAPAHDLTACHCSLLPEPPLAQLHRLHE